MSVARRGCAHSRGRRARRAPALTSGKAPSAKTISSDVFPQPPSPTRTTLTDRAPRGASSSAAWDAFIAGPAERPGAERRPAGLRRRPGAGKARRGRNVEGAGRREEVRAGQGAGERLGSPGERPGRDRGARGEAAGRRPFPSHPTPPLEKDFLSTYCVPARRPQQGWIQTQVSILRRELWSGGGAGARPLDSDPACRGCEQGKTRHLAHLPRERVGHVCLPAWWGQELGSRCPVCPVQIGHRAEASDF